MISFGELRLLWERGRQHLVTARDIRANTLR
jgi:hypothetical protein